MTPPEAAPMREDVECAARSEVEQKFWSIVDRDGLSGLPSDMWGALDRLVLAWNRQAFAAAPMREDVTQAIEAAARAMCDRVNGIGDYDENIAQRRPGWVAQAKACVDAYIAHTARPDAGDAVAYRYRFRDEHAHMSPGSNPWIVANQDPRISRTKGWRDLRVIEPLYSTRPDDGDEVAAREVLDGFLQGDSNPTYAQALAAMLDFSAMREGATGVSVAQVGDAGDEVERVIQIIHDECENDDDSEGGAYRRAAVRIAAMREGVDRGMVEVPREPTMEQLNAAVDATGAGCGMAWNGRSPQKLFAQGYAAMLEAAALSRKGG